ncbi:ABC transporter permease [Sphingobacterium multivorum]|uniref:ABC transporter permease n=1 Tax=Sphingobacterium multivorum TaxID=28454 RepID=UPI00289B0B9F|nr:FtsX-like permease family protein [Sphingobacterium multivorum]
MMSTIKLIFRQLWRNRLFTFLNVFGLAIGISACWLIFRIVNYEFSFDQHHPKSEQIYKVHTSYEEKDKLDHFDGVPAPLPAYIKENFVSVELTVPIFKQYFERVSNIGDTQKIEFEDQPDIIGTTGDYFKMTPYVWLAGDQRNILKNSHEVILTESRAKLYFPNRSIDQIIGQTLSYDSTLYNVTGIVKDLAHPSSFLGKEFIQIPEKEWNSTNWNNSNSNWQLFIKVKSSASLPNLIKTADKKAYEMTHAEFDKFGFKMHVNTVPLKDLHFTSYAQNNVNKKIMYGLIGIGIFLLLLACVNYINLATAQIPQRAKEIGIRKTLGESQKRITKSFLLETFCITAFSVLLSWPLLILIQTVLASYIPDQLKLYPDPWGVSLFLATLTITITLISSGYPILLTNKVKIVEVIKISNAQSLKFGNLSFRKMLIIFQFLIAQLFVISTCIIGLQLKHALQNNSGFDKDAIITLRFPSKSYQDSNVDPFVFKQAIKHITGVEQASLGHLPMSNDHWGNALFAKSDTGQVQADVQMKFVDQDNFKLYNFKMLAGRPLQLADTSTGIVLNLATVQKLGFKSAENAVGSFVTYTDKQRQIVGVTDNFHTKNLHAAIQPVVMLSSIKKWELNRLSVKLNSNSTTWTETLKQIEKEWKRYYPKAPFKYDFYDQQIKELYSSDLKFSKIINLFTSTTILISCLGLIGLVTITTVQRTKEIGIRKVLGSTVLGIIGLLSKDYIKLILISILIATPIAWWAMHKWLDDFAYKIELSWWMFIIPAAATLLIAFFTMSYQSIKAARANPVHSLRDE